MGRYGIDYISVREAAEQLTAQGEAVTVERVRAALGSGSFTTLGKHLRTWRRMRDPAAVGDQALPELISDAAQTVWANLSRAAEQRVAEAQSAAQSAVAVLQEQQEEALAAAASQAKVAKQQQQEAERHFAARLDEAKRQITALEQQLQELRKAHGQAERLAGQGAEKSQQLAERLAESQAQCLREQQAHEQAQDRAGAAEAHGRSLVAAHKDALAALLAAHHEDKQQWQAQKARDEQQLSQQHQVIEHLQRQQDAQETVLGHFKALATQQAQLRDDVASRLRAQTEQWADVVPQIAALQDKALNHMQLSSNQDLRALAEAQEKQIDHGLMNLERSIAKQLRIQLLELKARKD